jgi:hypothetical protein
MKRIMWIILSGTVLITCLFGCGQSDGGRGTEADVKAIRKLVSDFCAAHKYNDGAKLAEFYTDDAMLMPSDEPIVSGRQAIASRYQQDAVHRR